MCMQKIRKENVMLLENNPSIIILVLFLCSNKANKIRNWLQEKQSLYKLLNVT